MSEYERLFVQITKEQKEWLENQAQKKDRSVAWIVRSLINNAMVVNDI